MTTSNAALPAGLIWLLRAEGLAVLAGCTIAYGLLGQSWILAAALFLVPDLSMLGYLLGPRAGAITYNIMHAYVGPVALGACALLLAMPPLSLAIALIWGAHIGLDRALGFGLKEARGFRHTHLGLLGKS